MSKGMKRTNTWSVEAYDLLRNYTVQRHNFNVYAALPEPSIVPGMDIQLGKYLLKE